MVDHYSTNHKHDKDLLVLENMAHSKNSKLSGGTRAQRAKEGEWEDKLERKSQINRILWDTVEDTDSS